MIYSGTDPESYITEYTSVYENKVSDNYGQNTSQGFESHLSKEQAPSTNLDTEAAGDNAEPSLTRVGRLSIS